MLRRSQKELVNWIVEFSREHKCGPMQRHVAEAFNTTNAHKSLGILIERGYLTQPYEGGPYLPLKDVDGTPIKIELVREGEASGSASAPAA